MSSFVTAAPRLLLRAEGLLVLVAATISYAQLGAGWLLFALLFLAPDISMAGYLVGRKAGAATYNIGHSYVAPLTLLSFGLLGSTPLMLCLGLIWAAHIGFDRVLGYGLKYSDGFDYTHLGRISAAGMAEKG